MLPTEDSYGLAKRLEFVIAEIERRNLCRVLDFGCGTGANLTVPLGERFPRARFTGVDNDGASIEHVRLSYEFRDREFRLDTEELAAGGEFEAIIPSEVLEHVAVPDTLRAGIFSG
jgi:2-polyprenyl-3-methyl-5-hydroxy-6-metoxy-1,4-benzoquinol methylase